jgi:hypothetical protein
MQQTAGGGEVDDGDDEEEDDDEDADVGGANCGSTQSSLPLALGGDAGATRRPFGYDQSGDADGGDDNDNDEGEGVAAGEGGNDDLELAWEIFEVEHIVTVNC